MKRKIILLGRMGELFGKEHYLVCNNMQEAIHALDCLKGDVRRYLLECNDKGIDFLCKRGDEILNWETIPTDLGKDDLIISPVPRGAFIFALAIAFIGGAFAAGVGTALGIALIVGGTLLALKGIIDMLTPEFGDDEEEDSNLFKGPINNAKVGIPVPLCYGKLQVGGAPINFAFTETRLRSSEGFTFGSKSDSGGGNYGGGGYSGGDGGGSGGGGSSAGSTPIIALQ
tara:strand:+ start:542 stop:1225 length:684 start_codon:yes stop_codon:yes gene_type:complete